MCFPFAAEALGPVPNTFASGGVISATAMNDNFTHLQNAITAVEGKVPAATCGANQISRFNGTNWECSDDATLTTTDLNLNIDDVANTVSLNPDLSLNSVTVRGVNISAFPQWNNSNTNAAPEMSVFTHAPTCDASHRGQIRIWQHEDISNSLDLADALCFCQRYIDRTPEPDVTYYTWNCLYRPTDGN